MFEVVDIPLQAHADLVHPVRVRDDHLAALVRRLDHRLHLGVRHLILIDQLDHVHPGVQQRRHFLPRVLGAVHTPAERFLIALVRLMLNERACHIQTRTGNFAARDALLHRENVIQTRTKIARRGDTGHQQLPRCNRHHRRRVLRAVQIVPALVVAVAEDVEMHVHVDQAGHDGVPVGVDHRRASGHWQFADAPDAQDSVAGDENHAVLEHRTAVAIDDPSANDGHRDFRRRLRHQRAVRAEQRAQRRNCPVRDAHQ